MTRFVISGLSVEEKTIKHILMQYVSVHVCVLFLHVQTLRHVYYVHMHNRRYKNKCCISVPVQGRAMRGEKTKKKVRFRIDPETQQIVSWLSFRQRHTTIMPDNIFGLWKKLPRVTRPSKARLWEGEAMTWSQCMDRYGEIYDMSSLLIWYKRLPRAENLGRKGAYQ